MSESLEEKMSQLMQKVDDYRPDQQEEIVRMQKTIKTAMLKKNFKQHPALTELLSLLKKREESYSLILSNKEDLTETQRFGYIARRREVRWLISFFEVDKTLKTIEQTIDYQLSDEVKPLSTGGDE